MKPWCKHPAKPVQQQSGRCRWVLSGLGILGITCLTSSLLEAASQPLRAPAPQIAPYLSAIVQLKGLNVPPPQIKGSATLPLSVLDQTQVFTAVGLLGKRSGQFLIDTGASTTMLSAALVKALQLQGRPVPGDKLASAVAGNECSSMNATLHTLPTLRFQTVEVKGLSGLKFENTVIPEGLSGVLGMDVLGRFDLQLHPQARTLKLTAPTPLPIAAADQAVPLQKKLGVFLAKLTMNGQGPFTLLLDTGADSTFISEEVAARIKLDPKNREPIQIQGFCGLEPATRSRVATLKLYQHEQSNLEAIVLTSSILKLLGVDGILGQNFLQHYQQHWRFTPAVVRSSRADGSLLLSPIPVSSGIAPKVAPNR